jgi:hypothetical protein
MKKILNLLLLATVLISCESSKKGQKEAKVEKNLLADDLIGEWKNLALTVNMKNGDIDSILNVPEGQWEKVLNIKPIATTFTTEGTYTSVYKSLEDEIMMTSSGTWAISGDTLRMTERGEDNYYHTKIENGIGTFTGYIDWDQDGEADDLYTGTQKKQ